MKKEDISPYASFLEYSEEMYLMLDDIKTLITFSFGFVILIILFIIDGYFKFNFLLNNFWIFGLIAGVFAFVIIYTTIPVYNNIKKWEKNYINSSLFMTFSLLPLEEDDYPEDLLLFKILHVFKRYKNILDDYSWEMVLENFTNVTIEGSKKEHHFDVFIASTKGDDDKETKKMMDALKDKGYIVAKIFDKETPVNSSDLDEYRSEILDATLQRGVKKVFTDELNPFRIIAVSNSSFTDDAIEYVKNRDNWIKKVSFDLIEQKDGISNIIWIS